MLEYPREMKLIITLVVASLGLVACDVPKVTAESTAESTTGSRLTTEPTTLPVRVADGYVGGANVWLDLNDNSKQDDGEPAAITKYDGTATLALPTGTDVNHPIVVNIPVGATDSDQPNGVYGKAVTFKAPVGKTFISPITTLIQNEVEKGISIASAKYQIQNELKLGSTDIDLFEDFIAAKNDDTKSDADKVAFLKVHRTAQVVTSAIAKAINAGTTAVSAAETKMLLQLIMDDLKKQLTAIVAKIDELEPEEPFIMDKITVTEFDISKLTDEMEKQKAKKSAIPTKSKDIKAQYVEGFFSAHSGNDGNDGYKVVKIYNGKSSIIKYTYNSPSSSCYAIEDKDNDIYTYTLEADRRRKPP
jgi:hypothetical protein